MNNYIVNNNTKTPEILLYGYIGNWKDTDSKRFISDLKSLEAKHQQINVRINSGGGDVFEGITIYNALKNSTADIHVYIDGLAASMASVIALSGRIIYMSRFAQLMVHRVSGTANGDAEKLRETAALMDELEKNLITIYAERTGKTADVIQASWMQRGKDTWFNATDALQQKLVDKVFDGIVAEAPINNESPNAVWEFYNHQISNQLNNHNSMLLAQFKNQFNLPESATEQDVFAAIQSQHNKNKLLQEENEKLKSDNAEFQNQLKTAQQQKVTDLVSNAIKENRITEEQRPTYTALAEANYDATKAALSAITPYKSIVSQINATSDDAPEYKTFRDYQEKAPHLLAAMKENEPAKYNALYKKEFGKLPKP
jgi:ATP-dependent protease ClpP protease subunit